MSVDSVLDSAFTALLLKAQQEDLPAITRPISINIVFSNPASAGTTATVDPTTGLPISTGSTPTTLAGASKSTFPGFLLVPCPCALVYAVILAVDDTLTPVAVDASIEARVTTATTATSSVAIYGSGPMPALSGAGIATLDTTGWVQNFSTGDIVLYSLYAYTGTATAIGLLLLMRPTDVPQGVDQLVDSTGAPMLDSSGQQMVITE